MPPEAREGSASRAGRFARGGRERGAIAWTISAGALYVRPMKSSRWFLFAALLAASCKEDPAIAGKFKGNVMAHFDPTAPGGKTAQSDTAAADGVEITPLENSRYRVAFGGCSAVLERPTKSSANKGIWTFVSGGPCATKQGEATITGGELIDFEKGSFTLGLKGMTKDEKLNVSWTFVTAGGSGG